MRMAPLSSRRSCELLVQFISSHFISFKLASCCCYFAFPCSASSSSSLYLSIESSPFLLIQVSFQSILLNWASFHPVHFGFVQFRFISFHSTSFNFSAHYSAGLVSTNDALTFAACLSRQISSLPTRSVQSSLGVWPSIECSSNLFRFTLAPNFKNTQTVSFVVVPLLHHLKALTLWQISSQKLASQIDGQIDRLVKFSLELPFSPKY